jgi:selenocysteine lyase/cysteine desulfurase
MLGDRSLFPDLEARAYFNHAAVAPVSTPVRDACRAAVDAVARRGAGAWLELREGRERLRSDLARLLGAAPADLALVPSTSQGVVDIALCLPWRAGDRVVLFEGEFPANVTPWQAAARRFDLEVALLPAWSPADPGRTLERLAATLAQGARLVAVSAVQFQTGLRVPLPEIAAACARHGSELFVDGIQAVGALPLDAGALGVDYLVAGSHKWLMGVEGCGVLYVRPDRARALRPVVASWLSHEEPTRFLFEGSGHLRYDRAIRARADFLEIGAMNSIGFAALAASVALLLEHGVAAIHQHVNRLLDRLEAGLQALGCASVRAGVPELRSCILSVEAPPDVPVVALADALRADGIACSNPDGLLRFSPHWPNDLREADAVVAAAESALRVVRHGGTN